MTICAIKSHIYYSEKYGGAFITIHIEDKFKGQLKKAQPISQQ